MAFGEAVFTKTFDLLEAALGEFLLVFVQLHAVDEVVLQLVNGARSPESRHGTPQLVGLGRREARTVDRDLHRLLLKQRHAARALQDGFQLAAFVLWIRN